MTKAAVEMTETALGSTETEIQLTEAALGSTKTAIERTETVLGSTGGHDSSVIQEKRTQNSKINLPSPLQKLEALLKTSKKSV